MPVAKSRVFQLWNEFEKFPNAVALKWVGSTDPRFNRFPGDKDQALSNLGHRAPAPPERGLPLGRDGNTVRVVSQRLLPGRTSPVG